MKIASIVGARPQFIKIVPIGRKIRKKEHIRHLIVHTGQHYDYRMSKVFFDELGIPEPDYNLEVGSGNHGSQTGEMIKRIEEVFIKEGPDWVIVYGDTNSTLAGALAGAKLHIPVAHVEAGLRSYNRKMPEEINRVLTDHCSTILFCPTETAVENLKKEGFTNIVNNGKLIDPTFTLHSHSYSRPVVINVGDVMYDAMLICLKIAEKESNILQKFSLEPKKYILATIHRAENTDNPENLKNIFQALSEISKEIEVIVPLHPRTKKLLHTLHLMPYSSRIMLTDPVSYFDMLILEKNVSVILTDSGGVQKEAYWLKVPCVTLREETEWMELVEHGVNRLAGADKEKIIVCFQENQKKQILFNNDLYGNGKASGKIIEAILKK